MPAHRSSSRRGDPASGGRLSNPLRTAAEMLGTVAAASGDTGAIYVAIAGGDSPAHVFDGHERLVCALQFSTDGERLYSASHDGTFRVWLLPDSPRT